MMEKITLELFDSWAGDNATRWELLLGGQIEHATEGWLKVGGVTQSSAEGVLLSVGKTEEQMEEYSARLADWGEYVQLQEIPADLKILLRENNDEEKLANKLLKAFSRAARKQADNSGTAQKARHTKTQRLHTGTIEDSVRRRKITEVYHFTPIDNLPGILANGISPRSTLLTEAKKRRVVFNDEVRVDHSLDTSSLSVGFPNYRLFYRFRQNFPERRWAVIVLKPDLLWSMPCLFNRTNAASHHSSRINRRERITIDAFENMFEDRQVRIGANTREISLRAHLGLADWMTTDPQAEVLVVGMVPVTFFKAIAFAETNVQIRAERIIPKTDRKVPLVVEKNLFGPRDDFQYWKNEPYASLAEDSSLDDEIPF